MEISCTRCHQAVETDNCYCPTCGLPQLIYSADAIPGQVPAERWNEAVRDASSVDWKPALRAALILAVPAGLLSSLASPMAFMGLFWMGAAAAWAVVLYVRSQRPAWITAGAGARIGLVTGLLGGWLAFSASGGALFVERYAFHQSSQIDGDWKTGITMGAQLAQQVAATVGPAFEAQVQANQAQNQASMLSTEGHAGWEAFDLAGDSFLLLLFAVGGGALGARMLARTRRPEA